MTLSSKVEMLNFVKGNSNRRDTGSSLRQYHSSSKHLSAGKREGTRLPANSIDSKDIKSDAYSSGQARLDRVLAKLRKIAPLPGEDLEDPEADVTEIIQIWREELSEMNAQEQESRAFILQRLKVKGISHSETGSTEVNPMQSSLGQFWDDSFTEINSGEANRSGKALSVKFANGSGGEPAVRRETIQVSRMSGSGQDNTKLCKCHILEPELAELKKENAILRSSLQQLKSIRGSQPIDNKGGFAGSPSFKVGAKKSEFGEPAARAGDPLPTGGEVSAITYYQSKISLLETDLAASHIKCQRLEDHLELIADSFDQELEVVEEDLLRALPVIRHFLPPSPTTSLHPSPPDAPAPQPQGSRGPDAALAQLPRAASHCSQACQTDPMLSPDAERRQALLAGLSPAPSAPPLGEQRRDEPALRDDSVSRKPRSDAACSATERPSEAVEEGAASGAAGGSARDGLAGGGALASEPFARGRAGSVVLTQRVLNSGYPSPTTNSHGGPGPFTGGPNPSNEQKEQIQRLLRRIDELTRERDSLSLRIRTEEAGRRPAVAGELSESSKLGSAPTLTTSQPLWSNAVRATEVLTCSSSLQETVRQVLGIIDSVTRETALVLSISSHDVEKSGKGLPAALSMKSIQNRASALEQKVDDFHGNGIGSPPKISSLTLEDRNKCLEEPSARDQWKGRSSATLLTKGQLADYSTEYDPSQCTPKHHIDASIQTFSQSDFPSQLSVEIFDRDQDYFREANLLKILMDAGQQTESDPVHQVFDASSQTELKENSENSLEQQPVRIAHGSEPKQDTSCENSNFAKSSAGDANESVSLPNSINNEVNISVTDVSVQTDLILTHGELIYGWDTGFQKQSLSPKLPLLREYVHAEQQMYDESPIQEPENVQARSSEDPNQLSNGLEILRTEGNFVNKVQACHATGDVPALITEQQPMLQSTNQVIHSQHICTIDKEIVSLMSRLTPIIDCGLENVDQGYYVAFNRLCTQLQTLVKERAALIAAQPAQPQQAENHDSEDNTVFNVEAASNEFSEVKLDSTPDMGDRCDAQVSNEKLPEGQSDSVQTPEPRDSTAAEISLLSSTRVIGMDRSENSSTPKFKIMALPDEEITRRGVSMLMKTPARLSHAGSARIQNDARKNRLESLLPTATKIMHEASTSSSNLPGLPIGNPIGAAYVVYGEDTAQRSQHMAKALEEALIQLRKEQEKVKQLTEKRKEIEKQAYTKAYATFQSKLQHANYQGTLMDKCATAVKAVNVAPLEQSFVDFNVSQVEGLPHAPKFPARTSKQMHGVGSKSISREQQSQLDTQAGRKSAHEKSDHPPKRKSTPERDISSLEPWLSYTGTSHGDHRLNSNITTSGYPNTDQNRRLPIIEKQTRQKFDSSVIVSTSGQLSRMISLNSDALDFPEISGASENKAILSASIRNSPRKFSSSDLYAIDENSSSWLE